MSKVYPDFDNRKEYALGAVVKSGEMLYIAVKESGTHAGFNYWKCYIPQYKTPKGNRSVSMETV